MLIDLDLTYPRKFLLRWAKESRNVYRELRCASLDLAKKGNLDTTTFSGATSSMIHCLTSIAKNILYFSTEPIDGVFFMVSMAHLPTFLLPSVCFSFCSEKCSIQND